MTSVWEHVLPQTQRRPLADLTGKFDLTAGDRHSKVTAFWAMLVLSGFVAVAGVLADSTATVIGAMIIAPLSVPIMGIAAGIVLGEDGRFASFARVRGSTTATWGALLCDTHAITEVLLRYGRGADLRVTRALAIMVDDLADTPQGRAWQCRADPASGFRGPGRKGDVCPQVTLEALRACSWVPADRRPPRCSARPGSPWGCGEAGRRPSRTCSATATTQGRQVAHHLVRRRGGPGRAGPVPGAVDGAGRRPR